MVKKIKLSVVAASVALVMTGCSSKFDLMSNSNSIGWDTVHECAVYTVNCKKPAAPVAPAPAVDGDDDNDGVKNSMDKCPRSAPYTKVDADGCEVVDGDDDKDGVLNSVDKCPTTPAGKTVEANGCCPAPVDGDDDNDGVLNSMDKCPATPANVKKVDAEGCATEVHLKVNFEFDSAEVTADSMDEIKSFGTFMNDRASYKARIEGHTDSSGPAEYNEQLSQKRAEAVANLIASEGGVAADRLEAVGKGESAPIADNATREGRKANRRTEAHIIK